jgi:integrase/recombinase XerD
MMLASPQSRDARGEDRSRAGAQARLAYPLDRLQVMDLAVMLRELTTLAESAVKDKTYQRTPIGQEVRRWFQVLQYEGAPQTTLDSYEDVVARLAWDFADFEVARFCEPDGVDYLRDFLSRRWGEASIGTRRHHLYALRSFFDYQVLERGLLFNPARKIKPPRRPKSLRVAHERSTIRQLLDGQDNHRDRAGLHLMCRLGLRKNDLRELRVGEIDLARNVVRLLHRKGDDPLILPLVYPDLLEDLYLHIQAGGRQPEELLIYPKQHRLKPMSKPAFHRWFKRCLEKADLPDFPMHELRHTAGTEMYRETKGDLIATQMLLGHRSLETTRTYVHSDEHDLRKAMKVVAAAWDEDAT